MDLASLGVHHHGHSVAFLFIQLSHSPDHLPVPAAIAVTHVDPRHVHPPGRQRFQLLQSARSRPDRAHKLRPPRAAEAVLLELRLSNSVHVDQPGAGNAVFGRVSRRRQRRRRVQIRRRGSRDPEGATAEGNDRRERDPSSSELRGKETAAPAAGLSGRLKSHEVQRERHWYRRPRGRQNDREERERERAEGTRF